MKRFVASAKQKGMTLIEIMIVLAILGGLATVLITQVTSRLKSAKMKEARLLIQNVGNALDLYYTDCGSYPQNLDGLLNAPSDCQDWGPDPYVKRIPRDPWNGDLIYELDGSSYVLISLGSDRQEGGDGDAQDISSDDI